MPDDSILMNRAPVLTLWGAVVAEHMGHGAETALTLGKAMAGLNAQAKGRRLGIYSARKGPEGTPPKKTGLGEEFWIDLCGRAVPAKSTDAGVRAVVKDRPIDPASVLKYLQGKFKEHYEAVREAMCELAESYDPDELADAAFGLYEQFRPEIPSGKKGWGRKGTLDLDLIRSLKTDASGLE